MRLAGASERVLLQKWASQQVAGVLLHRRLIRDRSLEDRLEEDDEQHRREQLPDNLEAGGVLLEDEDHRADHELEQHEVRDQAVRASRAGSRIHLVPVVGADVGAVTQVVACTPGRNAGAGAGCADLRAQSD